MNEQSKANYYAIIPSTILFNENLKANEKLLYAVITVLANKEGYCFASNSYLGGLLNVQPHTISKCKLFIERIIGSKFLVYMMNVNYENKNI